MNPEAAVTTDAGAEEAGRHLRPVEPRRVKFAAVDHDVARVLLGHRGPLLVYGVLATAWFEFADPERAPAGKQRVAKGDWVEVEYRLMLDVAGTRSKASVTRWLDVLTEQVHECPWRGCTTPHPLVVKQRQGQAKPNRYRKWRCGEDELVVRRRSESESWAGHRLHGQSKPSSKIDDQLALEASRFEASSEGFRDALPRGDSTPQHEASERLAVRLQVASPQGGQSPRREASLRVNGSNVSKLQATATTVRAAAGEQTDGAADDVDAVACEVAELILGLARRAEPSYDDKQAWSVARRLAAAVLAYTNGVPAKARALLLAAIASKKLDRYNNPVGLLIRGIVGDKDGADRFLLDAASGAAGAAPSRSGEYATPTGLSPGAHAALLDALRSGKAIGDTWLREHDIPYEAFDVARAEIAREVPPASKTPLLDNLEREDPAGARARLEAIAGVIRLPARFVATASLDHPMVRGMSRSRLERELREADGDAAGAGES